VQKECQYGEILDVTTCVRIMQGGELKAEASIAQIAPPEREIPYLQIVNHGTEAA